MSFRGDLHFEHVGVGPFFVAHVYVDSPRHLMCITTCPIGCSGVSVNGVVCAVLSRLFEDIAVNRIVSAVLTLYLCFYEFA